MRTALAQINTTVGDVAGNERLILDAYRRACAQGADLVVFPELAVPGYPPRDLLHRHAFVEANLAAIHRLASNAGPVGLLVGFVNRRPAPGRGLTNSAALLAEGRIAGVRDKTLLPTYDVFDEDRYFDPAASNEPLDFRGVRLGVTICEDVWNDEDFWPERRYRPNPAVELASAGADLILNLSASPWHEGKHPLRRAMLRSLAAKIRKPVVYCNLVGGNDELVFDGHSVAVGAQGQLLACGAAFAEDLVLVDIAASEAGSHPLAETPAPAAEELLYRALTLGARDYLRKCGFSSAVLGLSGGIDSALVACLASAALGPDRVLGVSLPSRHSSQGSLSDAKALAENLGIRHETISIEHPFCSVLQQLAPTFSGLPEDTTEENLQARLRGVILMALSNKFGSLLLTTGNKSEIAVGYCTLYGDMCGGLAVINDLPKTAVYRLSRWINADAEQRLGHPLIPASSLTKAPSAELRPNQTDQDSLPAYETLDAILEAYVVQGRSTKELIESGQDPATVRRVVRLIENSEYKRRQAAPGLRVTSKAFGLGRRYPVAQAWREA